MDCNTPGLPVHHQLAELTQTHVHWVSVAIQPSHPLSSPSLPTFNLSQHQGLFSESVVHIRWPKYWSFSFSISPSSEYSRLISFRMDWLDLPVAQGTLKSLLQHHSSKASILQCSAFSIVQLSHPYMTTVKTIAWTRQTFVGKVMSLLFNMLSINVNAAHIMPWKFNKRNETLRNNDYGQIELNFGETWNIIISKSFFHPIINFCPCSKCTYLRYLYTGDSESQGSLGMLQSMGLQSQTWLSSCTTTACICHEKWDHL